MGEPMDRSKRVFGRLTALEEAFPTIEVATISSYEVGDGVPTFGVDESQRRTLAIPVAEEAGMRLMTAFTRWCARNRPRTYLKEDVQATKVPRKAEDRGLAVGTSFTTA
jgi:hypothetical protein